MPHSPENPARFPFSVYTSETGGSQANWTVASFAVLLFVSVGVSPLGQIAKYSGRRPLRS